MFQASLLSSTLYTPVHPISLLLPEVLGVHEHKRRERLKLWPQAWQSRQVSLEGVGMAVLCEEVSLQSGIPLLATYSFGSQEFGLLKSHPNLNQMQIPW